MAYMVSSLCVVVLCVVLQHHPTAAFTCYSCSATSPEDSCCSAPDSAQTCEGSGCATVYYPDGSVTRMCDGSANHGCHDVGENTVCGCHEDLCNVDPCPQTNGTSSAAVAVFPTSGGFAFILASILGLVIY